MKFTEWFDSWEWLKCSSHDWNFARVVAYQLFIINTLGLIAFAIIKNGFQDFTNIWSVIAGCSGYIVGIVVYGIEIIFRERAKIKFKIGDKEYGFENDKAESCGVSK